jgi:hypothetical protein
MQMEDARDLDFRKMSMYLVTLGLVQKVEFQLRSLPRPTFTWSCSTFKVGTPRLEVSNALVSCFESCPTVIYTIRNPYPRLSQDRGSARNRTCLTHIRNQSTEQRQPQRPQHRPRIPRQRGPAQRTNQQSRSSSRCRQSPRSWRLSLRSPLPCLCRGMAARLPGMHRDLLCGSYD